MTPIAIALFILGLAIGLLISYVTVAKRMGKSLDRVFDQELLTYKFAREWAEITDKQYKEYSEYTSKVIDLLKQEVDVLVDNDKVLVDAVKDMAVYMDNTVQKKLDKFTINHKEVYDMLHDDIEGMIATNDNRWDLLQNIVVDDHIHLKRMSEACNNLSYAQSNLERLLKIIGSECPDITITPGWDLNRFFIEMYAHGQTVEATFDISEYQTSSDLEAAFIQMVIDLQRELQEKVYPERKFKGGTTNEHEEMAAGAGASEGGDAGHQEAEQDAVLSGSPDGKLVQSELAEDRVGDSPEAEESQEFDVSVLRAAADAKQFNADVTYDYDQH